jgi:hypothetical protein
MVVSVVEGGLDLETGAIGGHLVHAEVAGF